MDNEIILLRFSYCNILTYPKYRKYNTRYFLFNRVAKYIGKNGYNVKSVTHNI